MLDFSRVRLQSEYLEVLYVLVDEVRFVRHENRSPRRVEVSLYHLIGVHVHTVRHVPLEMSENINERLGGIPSLCDHK